MKTKLNIIVLIWLGVLFISCKQETKNTQLSGAVFGTTYSIQYYTYKELNFEKQIDSLFYAINKSMSTYMENSDISKLNRNEDVLVDKHFLKVYHKSNEVYNATKGAFDPTIGVLVNAWDFGPPDSYREGKIENLDSLKIHDLLYSVGFNKVQINGLKILKLPETYLDFNAIAKGYAVDVVAEFLDSKSIPNYLIEIGGEMRAQGINMEKGGPWRIGLDEPLFDGTQAVLKVIDLQNIAMATSGTYRKFKIDEDGNRYAHIIDTKTGYPSKTNLLSISVMASDCMTADAYATAFKAMGIEKVKSFLKEHPELKVFLIFESEDKELKTIALNGFPEE